MSFLRKPEVSTKTSKKKKKHVKHEAAFQTMFSRGFKEHTSAYHKLSDQSQDTKPWDCFGQYKGIMYAMELKTHTSLKAFAFNKVENHQYSCLEEFVKQGAYGVIVIEVKNKSDHFIVFEEISEFINRRNNAGRKSIPYCDLLLMKRMKFGKTLEKGYKCVIMDSMFSDAKNYMNYLG